MSKFLRGTMILMVAGLITRLLGFINRIVIARMIGAEGVGLFMMAFPTLILVITLTQMGLPVAISKAVAEAEAKGDKRKTKKILTVSLAVTVSLSLLFTPALILAAPFLSKTLFTDQRIYYPLVAIAPIIPIVAISSVIRGYFQGKQNMKPAAVSQVLEQAVRIALIVFFAKSFLHLGIEYAAAAAMVASVLGELASLIYLFAMFKAKKKFPVRKHFFKSIQSGKQTLQELLSVGIPTTGSRMIGSLSWFFEPIVVSHSLLLAGVAAGMATKQYGLLTGYALPLLTLPSFITYSLSTALVPAVSEANASRNYQLVEYRLQQALRFALLTGGLAIVILYVYAEPLMSWMYGSSNGAGFIKLMAPFFIFHYYQGPLLAILQSLDLAKAAMINSLIGNAMKIGVIFVLASRTEFGINGVALGIAAGTVLITMLHYATVLKRIQFTIYILHYIKFGIAALTTCWIGNYLIKKVFADSMSSLLDLLIGILLTSLLYIILLICLKLLQKDDLTKIPFINKLIA
ncbi:stage V sporulation protein B [Lederbergia citrea]|uniref:Stage V sporulation protein B n=1 Tax=Lederbergia citrea TaxID=2833581 RepID=A0A942UJE9_9BACI|nr:stage V sporulation protein B [Lederbergia citrea]MBS4176222.1 stage V sporulation protein B [Lederbergia citrea]MBS4202782.1 stage V sporulation protein B [Lederbergia citrea]MBS4222550.1 stage V sporulation protein B [Lederbergia citrea]